MGVQTEIELDQELRDVVIIGSGPAGLTAAVYCARANLVPLVLEGELSSTGDQPGGQLMLTTEVENYPGFPDGVLGPVLMAQMRARGGAFRCPIGGLQSHQGEIAERGPHTVWFRDASERRRAGGRGQGGHRGHGCAFAHARLAQRAGTARPRRFHLRHLRRVLLSGPAHRRDRWRRFGSGGGCVLSRFAESVTVVHRRGDFERRRSLQDRALANPKVRFAWHSVVAEVLGDLKVEGLKLRDVKSGAESVLPVTGVFIAIGHAPNTDLLREQVVLDPEGYVVTQSGTTATSVDGVFAAGDLSDRRYRQAVTAAGSGCMAAIDVERWLEEH